MLSSANRPRALIRICLYRAIRPATCKPIHALTSELRPPIGKLKQCWNINQLIHRLRAHYRRLALGPTNPGTIYVAQEPLDFRCAGFSPAFMLLMPTFSLLASPPCLTTRLLRCKNAPLPTHQNDEFRSFGTMLSPGTFSAREDLTSELLRFL